MHFRSILPYKGIAQYYGHSFLYSSTQALLSHRQSPNVRYHLPEQSRTTRCREGILIQSSLHLGNHPNIRNVNKYYILHVPNINLGTLRQLIKGLQKTQTNPRLRSSKSAADIAESCCLHSCFPRQRSMFHPVRFALISV